MAVAAAHRVVAVGHSSVAVRMVAAVRVGVDHIPAVEDRAIVGSEEDKETDSAVAEEVVERVYCILIAFEDRARLRRVC
jgi:type III secretion system FlhB-like substrate exporter